MEIFDSNNSSSSDIMWESWETGVELRNSHVMWIAGDLKSTIGGPGAGGRGPGAEGRGPGDCTPTVAFPGKGGSAQKEGTFLRLPV